MPIIVLISLKQSSNLATQSDLGNLSSEGSSQQRLWEFMPEPSASMLAYTVSLVTLPIGQRRATARSETLVGTFPTRGIGTTPGPGDGSGIGLAMSTRPRVRAGSGVGPFALVARGSTAGVRLRPGAAARERPMNENNYP